MRKIKKENDRLNDDNGKLIGDVQRLLDTINQKKVQEIVTKQEKIIVESMAAHIRDLENAKYEYEQKLQKYESKLKGESDKYNSTRINTQYSFRVFSDIIWLKLWEMTFTFLKL